MKSTAHYKKKFKKALKHLKPCSWSVQQGCSILEKLSGSPSEAVEILEEYMHQLPSTNKIACMYLISAIMLKLDVYTQIFYPRIPLMFVDIFVKANTEDRQRLLELRKTWEQKVPQQVLKKLDCALKFVEPDCLEQTSSKPIKKYSEAVQIFNPDEDDRLLSGCDVASKQTKKLVTKRRCPGDRPLVNNCNPAKKQKMNNHETLKKNFASQSVLQLSANDLIVEGDLSACILCSMTDGKHSNSCLNDVTLEEALRKTDNKRVAVENNTLLSHLDMSVESPLIDTTAQIDEAIKSLVLSDAMQLNTMCSNLNKHVQNVGIALCQKCSDWQYGSTEQLLLLSRINGLSGEVCKHASLAAMISAEIAKIMQDYSNIAIEASNSPVTKRQKRRRKESQPCKQNKLLVSKNSAVHSQTCSFSSLVTPNIDKNTKSRRSLLKRVLCTVPDLKQSPSSRRTTKSSTEPKSSLLKSALCASTDLGQSPSSSRGNECGTEPTSPILKSTLCASTDLGQSPSSGQENQSGIELKSSLLKSTLSSSTDLEQSPSSGRGNESGTELKSSLLKSTLSSSTVLWQSPSSGRGNESGTDPKSSHMKRILCASTDLEKRSSSCRPTECVEETNFLRNALTTPHCSLTHQQLTAATTPASSESDIFSIPNNLNLSSTSHQIPNGNILPIERRSTEIIASAGWNFATLSSTSEAQMVNVEVTEPEVFNIINSFESSSFQDFNLEDHYNDCDITIVKHEIEDE